MGKYKSRYHKTIGNYYLVWHSHLLYFDLTKTQKTYNEKWIDSTQLLNLYKIYNFNIHS